MDRKSYHPDFRPGVNTGIRGDTLGIALRRCANAARRRQASRPIGLSV
jgi:hypothetical protein